MPNIQKIKMKSLEIIFSECPLFVKSIVYDSWEKVAFTLKAYSMHLFRKYPLDNGGAYKTDVLVTWDDGSEFIAKLTIHKNNDVDVGKHLFTYLAIASGVYRPKTMPEEAFEMIKNLTENQHAVLCKQLLEEYEIRDEKNNILEAVNE